MNTLRSQPNTRTSVPEGLAIAFITVCVSQQVIQQAAESVERMKWSMAEDHFDIYITDPKRLYISPQARAAQLCVVLVDFDQDPDAAITTVESLHVALPGKTSIIALSSVGDPERLLRAMRAGCSEYLNKPFDEEEFTNALVRIGKRSSSGAAQTHIPGQILSLFGAKGGVGTTTLAVHLAMDLVTNHKKKTLLIDNHAQFGHVCLYLGLEANSYHFHELIRNVNRLDGDLLHGFIIQHPSGLHVLASPESQGGVRNSDPEAIEQTLHFLREQYDYVLLDCAASFEETLLAVIDCSDRVFLIATPEIGAIRDLSRYVDALVRSEQTTDKLRLVMNRYSSKEAMSSVQIEKAVRLPLSMRVPNNYAELVKAINAGVPIASTRKSEFLTQITKWGNEIVGSTAPHETQAAKKSFAFWR